MTYSALTPLAVYAQDDFFADIEVDDQNPKAEDSNWSYKGYIQQEVKYGLNTPDPSFTFSRDEKGLTQVRSDIFNELSYRYSDNLNLVLSGKVEIDALQWDNGEQELGAEKTNFFLKDAYLDWVFANEHWLRIGHQLFAWGESEMLSISDVISPYDLREYGQTELRDIREQVPALLYSFPALGGKLSFVTTYDAGHNRYAAHNEEFYPYVGFDEPSHHKPEKNWETAIKYDYFLNGGDLQFVLAEVNDNNFTPELDEAFTPVLVQDRVQVISFAANRVLGSFQFKTEMGIRRGQKLQFGVEEDQLRAMLGLEYTGLNDWLFSVEADTIQGQGLSNGTPSDMALMNMDKTDTFGGNIHIQNTAWNERLTQHWWYFHMLNDDGSIFRWDAAYDLNDSWEISAALVLYDNDTDTSQLYPYRKNDTFNLAAKYNF